MSGYSGFTNEQGKTVYCCDYCDADGAEYHSLADAHLCADCAKRVESDPMPKEPA